MIESQTLRDWLQVLSVIVLPLGSAIYTWIATRDKDNSQHIKAVETALQTKIAEHASRIDRLESDMAHVPSTSAVTELLSDLKAMQATQEAAHREMHGMRLAINRIEDFLLKK
ncbi:MAG: hypothetical protein JNK28_01455 [Burkholderiaceae bacterium]|nr:hypothetical protein [Burkholderiaceae bacterium]